MEPLNKAERKIYRLKFFGMYSISIGLISVALLGFLQPLPPVKTVTVEKEKPARIITKTVYVTKKVLAENNVAETDSLKNSIADNQKKLDELNRYIETQKKIIANLQQQQTKVSKPTVNKAGDNNEVAELKKQIKFFDWALRSQVAVTNTLTKENNELKNKIAQLNKNK